MQESVLRLGPDDAGVKLTRQEFAQAEYQRDDVFATSLLPRPSIPLAECFAQI